MTMARLMEPVLARAAKQIVDKHRPLVVGISGSVGKTSAKDAVSCVLRDWIRTMSSPENQNDELGVPLSIIGARPSGRNPFGWFATLRRARRIVGSKNGSYPDCLVLEFGSCHVGDVEYLMRLSTPDRRRAHGHRSHSPAVLRSLDGDRAGGRQGRDDAPAERRGHRQSRQPRGRGRSRQSVLPDHHLRIRRRSDVRGLAAVSAIDWDRLTACTHLDVQCGEERGDAQDRRHASGAIAAMHRSRHSPSRRQSAYRSTRRCARSARTFHRRVGCGAGPGRMARSSSTTRTTRHPRPR